MKIEIEGLTVYFPYEYIYPEQYRWVAHACRLIFSKSTWLMC